MCPFVTKECPLTISLNFLWIKFFSFPHCISCIACKVIFSKGLFGTKECKMEKREKNAGTGYRCYGKTEK